MNVSGDAGTGGLADVHSKIYAVGAVEFAEDGLHALGKGHHFAGGFGLEFLQFV